MMMTNYQIVAMTTFVTTTVMMMIMTICHPTGEMAQTLTMASLLILAI